MNETSEHPCFSGLTPVASDAFSMKSTAVSPVRLGMVSP